MLPWLVLTLYSILAAAVSCRWQVAACRTAAHLTAHLKIAKKVLYNADDHHSRHVLHRKHLRKKLFQPRLLQH